jgi:hypothetical protein
MAQQFSLRKASMKWTDERAGRVLEVVGKLFFILFIYFFASRVPILFPYSY